MSEELITEISRYREPLRREDEMIVSRNRDAYSTDVEMETITCVAADTAYTYTVPNGTRRLEIFNRSGECRYAFKEGMVEGTGAEYKHRTQKTGIPAVIEDVKLSGKTLYVAATVAGNVVEIAAWR